MTCLRLTHREQVTWLSLIGIAMQDSQLVWDI